MDVEEIIKKYEKNNYEQPTIIDEHLIAKITVQSKEGWHARPITIIANTTSEYENEVYAKKASEGSDNPVANAKSAMQLLIMAAEQHSKVYLIYKLNCQSCEEIARKNFEKIVKVDFEFSK